MKIIFSRKGLDSSFGNCASPIMPDDRLCWMPIPEDNPDKPELPTYKDIPYGDTNLGAIIEDLSSGKISADRKVHLDPDIFYHQRNRLNGWKPVFGQTGAAESHLRNQQVETGDVFLFFGWFKQCMIKDNKFRYNSKAPDLHLVYGWMQIGEIIKISDIKEIPDWIKDHPHMLGKNYGKADTLYIATDKLSIGNVETPYAGSGIFNQMTAELVLTEQGKTRSVWKLPTWMYPSDNKPPLSYNENINKWSLESGMARLRIASRGQEFVLNADFYPEAVHWLLGLMKASENSV